MDDPAGFGKGTFGTGKGSVRFFRTALFGMSAVGIIGSMVLMELLRAVRPFEFMSFTGGEPQTNQNGE